MTDYFSHGHSMSNKNADILGGFIDSHFGGAVDAEDLVAAATPKKSPVHHMFEWDDTKAAHQYRLTQARYFIRHVYIKDDDGNEMRQYHNIVVDDTQQYLSKELVAESQDLVDQVIASALRELESWRNRYKGYKQFFGVVKEIDSLTKGVTRGKSSSKRSEGAKSKAKRKTRKKSKRKR